MTQREHYVQGPGVALTIGGSTIARRYFRREFGEAAGASRTQPRAALDACFARVADAPAGAAIAGSHKLARWRVRVLLRPDGAAQLRAQVQGPFGLPLVQSLILEPLIGVVAARHGLALVPGALVLDSERRGVLLVGGSGAGKTSLAARAIAAGREVLADDRVFVDAGATASRFTRRLRLYPDIRDTAPTAWDALALGPRGKLRAAGVLRAVSRDAFAPPVAVTRAELGAPPPPLSTPIGRILLLRREERPGARLAAVTGAAALDEIQQRIREDRVGLAGALPGDDQRRLADHDRAVLEAAAGAVAVQRLELPVAWPAARSVQRLAAELGIP